MKNNVRVSLTGGLGNQLFQLAAGLSIANSNLILETNIGRPRLNKEGRPEIASFNLPPKVSLGQNKSSEWLLSKALGYGLRMGISPRWYERFWVSHKFVQLSSSLIYFFYNRRFVSVVFAEDVGYFVLPKVKNVLLVGYFQSHIWASSENSLIHLRNLNLHDKSSSVDAYRKLSEIDDPLIVHVRLGDYLLEDSFGIPSAQYYEKAIRSMWVTGNYKRIWVFSDDIENAKSRVPVDLRDSCNWIHEVGESSASTLEVMRFGKGYVLANSSFSWWGCFLSYTENPEVIAPDPWFKSQQSPKNITPPKWQLIAADY